MSWLRARLELGRVTGATNLRPMEGLRGVAVTLVFLVHYATLVGWWVPRGGLGGWLIESVHDIGNVGVDLFFVLSGYLIYRGIVESRVHFATYLWRRVRRIYPAFLAVFSLYLVLSLYTGRTERMPADPAERWLYVLQNLLLLPGLFPIEPLIAVAWSLSYEFFFYLLMPLLVAIAGLRSRSHPWRLKFIAALTVLSFVAFATWGGPVRMMMFLAGMLMHELLCREGDAGWSSRAGVLAGMLALLVPIVPAHGPLLQALRTGLLYLCFLGLCLAALRSPEAGLGRLLSWTPLRWMGNISYSYYLLHGLALQVFFTLLQRVLTSPGDWAGLALLAPAWLSTLPPCLILYLTVERPLSLAIVPALAGHGGKG